MSATATATAVATNTVTTQQVVSWWSGMFGGLAIGTRRPTSYPEWVTLAVAQGGFATGRALATLQEGELNSTAFMEQGGLETLQEMLASGKYRVDQPENAALLVMVWLLLEGRQDEAKSLFAEIAPYMDELRFYPVATSEATAVSATMAAVNNVGKMRNELEALAQRYANPYGYRFEQMRRQSAVADGYAELQADAIELLLSTVADRDAFLSGSASDIHYNNVDEAARQDILKRAAALAQQYGEVGSHQRSTTTTAMVLEALRNPQGVDNERLIARIRAVAKSRGLKGSEQFNKYLARTRVSAIPDQRMGAKAAAVTARVASVPKEAHLTSIEAVLAPVSAEEDPVAASTGRTAIPEPIARVVRRAVEAPLEQLIKNKIIVSAEMIAMVMPHMLSAAVGECIEDPVARRLYAQLSIAFSQRRSLLLVNFEKQVRLEELPWARPLVALIKADDTKQCESVMREAVRCYFTYYPDTITPNKLVSAFKDVMRKGAITKANLMEELATDIFQNGFSPNFDAAAVVAARMLKGTLYARYYGLESMYDGLEAAYATAQQEIADLRSGKTKLEEPTDKRTAADLYAEAATVQKEHTLKHFEATGKVIPGMGHLLPPTPRGQKAQSEINDIVSEISRAASEWSEKQRAKNANTKDNEDDEAAQEEDPNPWNDYNKKVSVVIEKYYAETGKFLQNYEYQYPNYSETINTPRTQAAAKELTAMTSELYRLANERSKNPLEIEISKRLLLFNLATQKMADWQRTHDGQMYNSVQSGQTIEAAMIITTHNLAQLVDLCGGMPDFDFRKAAVTAWTSIVETFMNPPTNQLHGRRDMAYTWRQVLFYLTRLEGEEAQRQALAEMREVVEHRATKDNVKARLNNQFLTPLEKVIGGATHVIEGKVEDGAIVLGYYGWKAFNYDEQAPPTTAE